MYKNEFKRTNPGLFVFLVDQSGSMEDPLASNGLSLAVNAADAINSVINEIILKVSDIDNAGNDIVKKEAFISVIGYGGRGDGTGNQYDYEAETICDDWINVIEETKPKYKSYIDGTTELVEVVKPLSGGGTPMASAFTAARDLVKAWMQSHNSGEDPVPVIINITDGMPTDSETDLKNVVSEIKSLDVPDGNPLIFNIHLSSDSNAKTLEYPSDINQCHDKYSKLLFEISSETTKDLIDETAELQAKGLSGGEKLFMSNVTNAAVLTDFIKLGTRQKKMA